MRLRLRFLPLVVVVDRALASECRKRLAGEDLVVDGDKEREWRSRALLLLKAGHNVLAGEACVVCVTWVGAQSNDKATRKLSLVARRWQNHRIIRIVVLLFALPLPTALLLRRQGATGHERVWRASLWVFRNHIKLTAFFALLGGDGPPLVVGSASGAVV